MLPGHELGREILEEGLQLELELPMLSWSRGSSFQHPFPVLRAEASTRVEYQRVLSLYGEREWLQFRVYPRIKGSRASLVGRDLLPQTVRTKLLARLISAGCLLLRGLGCRSIGCQSIFVVAKA